MGKGTLFLILVFLASIFATIGTVIILNLDSIILFLASLPVPLFIFIVLFIIILLLGLQFMMI